MLGAIYLTSHTVRIFSPEEVSLLNGIGKQVGVAVENARLYEKAEEVAAAAERSRADPVEIREGPRDGIVDDPRQGERS